MYIRPFENLLLELPPLICRERIQFNTGVNIVCHVFRNFPYSILFLFTVLLFHRFLYKPSSGRMRTVGEGSGKRTDVLIVNRRWSKREKFLSGHMGKVTK